MAAKTSVLLGPARAGKTTRLLERYRAQLTADGPIGQALWIGPTHRAADAVRGQLVQSGVLGCLAPNCLTFSQFAKAVIDAALEPNRPLGKLEKAHILRRLLDEASAEGRLSHFAQIAAADGLLDQISELISDLKRQEIWPADFREICRRLGNAAKHIELADLYDRYQAILLEQRFYDEEGRFWSARDLMAKGQTAPFSDVALVVVDGFADFTRTQHEILAILHGRVRELLISLPWENGRDDLFQKSRLTLTQLEDRLPGLRPVPIARRESASRGWTADIAHVEEQIFHDPRGIECRPAADGIEILAAAGRLGEIELLARRIKRLLLEGDAAARQSRVGPDEVVVVFRSTDEVAPLVREVFAEYGIPVSLDDGIPLAKSPLIVALLAILKLDQQDWPFRALIDVIGNNYFSPRWSDWQNGAAAIEVERAIRSLQIPMGRRALLAALDRRARAAPDETATAERRGRQQEAQVAVKVVSRLAAVLDGLPTSATPADWAGALTTLADELGLFEAGRRPCDDPVAQNDLSAWQLLIERLTDTMQLDIDLDDSATTLDRRALLDRLERICHIEQLPRQTDDCGCVRVLSAAQVRSLDVPYLFVANLSERSFPSAQRGERVYSATEQQDLNRQGCRFVDRHERACEEMLLFYEVITRATRHLTLSYSALDDAAQPLSPSPYLTEVERLFDSATIQRSEAPGLSPVPEEPDPLSPRDLRVKSLAMALSRSPRLAGHMLCHRGHQATAGAIQAALAVIAQRKSGNTFNEHEGMLTSPAARQWLADRYGAEHIWSTSQLEQYGHCPYKFFLNRVLKLDELYDLSLEVDQLLRGRRAHALLANVHRRLASRPTPCSPCELDAEEFQTLVQEVLLEVMHRTGFDKSIASIDAALDVVDHRLVGQWIADYRTQYDQYHGSFIGFDSPPAPAHFEVSFGPVEGDEEDAIDPLSKPVAYELTFGGLSIRLSGRVDRIDVGVVNGRIVFNVLDYKTGKSGHFPLRDIEECRKLQLPLYAMAVQDLLLAHQDAIPWQAGYWHVPDKGYCAKQALVFHEQTGEGIEPTESWQLLRENVARHVAGLVRGVQSGEFPMYCEDEKCTGQCEYKTVCRVNDARSLEKTWQPPFMNPK